MTCKPALPPGEMLSPEGLWQQLQPPLSGGGAVTALGFDSGGGSSIQSFYTPVLMVRHGEMIGFLQVYFICCILQIRFICRISSNTFHLPYFQAFNLKAWNSVRALPPSPNSPAGQRQRQRCSQGGTSRSFFFGSSTGAEGNTDSLFTCP